MAMTAENFVKEIEGMTVLELNTLVKALEEKFGVSAAAMAMPMAAGPAAAAAPAEEEKTEFTVVLAAAGDKIKTIAELPSREELVSKLLFVMQSPMRRLVTVLNGPVRNLAGVMSQIADQKSKSGPAAATGMAIAAADTPNFSSSALTSVFSSRTVMPSISFTNVSAVIAMVVTSPLFFTLYA